MGSHLRSVIGWARGTKIGGDLAEQCLDQDTTVEVAGTSEGEQVLSLEPASGPQEDGQTDPVSFTNHPPIQLNSGPETDSNVVKSVIRPDLGHTLTETTTTLPAPGDVRSNIRNDLLSGKLEIPPFDDTMVPEKGITYQFPPALLDHYYVSKCKQRFDRSELLPNRNMPLSLKILGYAQSWGMWVAEIPDEEKRERLLDRVFEMATKAWFEALRIGYTPDVPSTQSAAPRTPKKRPAPRGEELPPRLRGWTKAKRDPSPSRMPFLVASHKSGSAWAVTVGELEEAGVSETRIQRRAADLDSLAEEGEDLLESMLELYDGKIAVSEWFETVPTTKLNPMGRDLQVYCIFEVLKSRESIDLLERYYAKQKTTKQKEATQRRIDEEQERQDLFMALALEVEEDDPRQSTPPPIAASSGTEESLSFPARVTARPETATLRQLEMLVDAAERIIDEEDIPYIISTLELYEISEDDIHAGPSVEELSNNSDRCKHIMRDTLLCARQLALSSRSAESSMDSDINVDMANLGMLINQKKEMLKVLLPFLVAERDAAKTVVEGLDAYTDKPDESITTSSPLADDMQMAEASDLALSTVTKRRLDDEEMDEAKLATPPTKKQKVVDKDKALQSSNTPTATGAPDATRAHLNNSQPRSPIVTLYIPPHHDLDHWSSKTVRHQQGFSYRYALESTLQERQSMTETLNTYIHGVISQSNNDWRFGKCHSLIHKDKPASMPVIHGVWNLENGDQPTGFKRFYGGGDDYQDEFDAALRSDSEEEDGEPISPQKRAKDVKHTKLQAPAHSFAVPLPKKQQATNFQSREGSRLIVESSLLPGSEAGTPRISSGRVKKEKQADTPKINTYGNMGKPKLSQLRMILKQQQQQQQQQQKQQQQTVSYHDTISTARPRRNAARKNYAEDVDDDNGDEDFDPLAALEAEGES
ncbi:hypothetical protein H2200_001363 [Cladophialophora chaetospira]|uniref:Uncharacterized protein n=1 Tax=Cladophialophora chaetospira TaxID=386627 RepID=A0AA38XKV6_9EURO|nr:hypothetical protein H2200_001363 [Cladophialophora chaetospira]